jgi:DNA polymerase-3 subunit beta
MHSEEYTQAGGNLRLVDDAYSAIPAGELLALVKAVLPAVPKKPTHSVLACIKLQAKDGILTATATDLNNFIVAQMLTEQQFCALVSAELFARWLEQCPDRIPLNFNLEEQVDEYIRVLHVRSSFNDLHYQFRSLDPDEFPETLEIQGESKSVEFEFQPLIEILKGAAKLACHDETKQVITGVHIEVENGLAHIRSTNGVVMCDRILPATGDDCKFTINRGLIQFLSKAESQTVTFQAYEEMVLVTAGTMVIRSRLIPGEYPTFENIAKPSNAGAIKCDRKALLNAFKRCCSPATKEDKSASNTWLSGCSKKQVIVVEGCNGTESLPAQVEDDPDASYLDYRLLEDILQCISSKEISLTLGRGRKNLVTIKPDGEGYYGLMGLHVEETFPIEEQDGALVVVADRYYITQEQVPDSDQTVKVEHHYHTAVQLPYEWQEDRLVVVQDAELRWKEGTYQYQRSADYKKAVEIPFEYIEGVLTVTQEYTTQFWVWHKPKTKKEKSRSEWMDIKFCPAVPLPEHTPDPTPVKQEVILPKFSDWFDDEESHEPVAPSNPKEVVLPKFSDWVE